MRLIVLTPSIDLKVLYPLLRRWWYCDRRIWSTRTRKEARRQGYSDMGLGFVRGIGVRLYEKLFTPNVTFTISLGYPFLSQYLIMNGVALLAISQHPRFGSTTRGFGKYAGALIGGGALVFSGSIFLLLLDRQKSVKTITLQSFGAG